MTSVTYISGLTCAYDTPMSIMPVSGGRVYAVNGKERGFVYTGTTAYRIGVTQAAAITASSVAGTPQRYHVSDIVVVDAGSNIAFRPSVFVVGVTGASATVSNGNLVGITFLESATTHTGRPHVSFEGAGPLVQATATAQVRGGVANVHVNNPGAGLFAAPPAVSFTASPGVTQTRAAAGFGVLSVAAGATSGPVTGVVVTDPGDYTFTAFTADRPVGAEIPGGPALATVFNGVVSTVSLSASGSGYAVAPAVRLSSNSPLGQGGGAQAVVDITSSGAVTNPVVIAAGNGYDGQVSVQLVSDPPRAVCVMAPRLAGKYLCGVRYVDADGVPGNLCELVEVDCGNGANSISWNLSTLTFSDGAPNRVYRAELWRTTSDQAITLYRVATVSTNATYVDSLPDFQVLDADRSGYAELPILTAEGYPSANRFGVPPSTFSTVCMYADRAWYAVDESGAEPNVLYFSEAGEPESVPPEYQVVLQSYGRDSDRITGLIPLNGALYVFQQRCVTRLIVAGNPLESASATPVAQRGLLNDRCWDKYENIAYVADSVGFYSFDGSAVTPLSDPVKEFWSEGRIDFLKASRFHVRVNVDEQVVRFYYVATGSFNTYYPDRALCYSTVTKAWWTESYAHEAASSVMVYADNRPAIYLGGTNLRRTGGVLTDAGTAIDYALKTGNYPLNDDPKRGVRLVYAPCAQPQDLKAELHYNGASTPRPNAIQSTRGTGFVTTTGSTQAVLNMSKDRSTLAGANGFAQFHHAGRLDDQSSGGDRHVAVRLSGQQDTDKVVLHSMQIEGAG